jgi:signal transduction histidine kinase
MLDDMGLLPALLWYFERYTAQTRIEVDFKHTGLNDGTSVARINTIAYRVVQETLTSLAHQDSVSKVTVRVWTDLGKLHIKIADTGGNHPLGSIAFVGLRERALSVGGKLRTHFAMGGGTDITAELPIMGAKRDSSKISKS